MELCSKLHPLVAKEVGSERSLLGKVDELHEKLDKVEKDKYAKKIRSVGKVNFVDEEEVEGEGIMAVEYGTMGGDNH